MALDPLRQGEVATTGGQVAFNLIWHYGTSTNRQMIHIAGDLLHMNWAVKQDDLIRYHDASGSFSLDPASGAVQVGRLWIMVTMECCIFLWKGKLQSVVSATISSSIITMFHHCYFLLFGQAGDAPVKIS
jgi:hypothetical protein